MTTANAGPLTKQRRAGRSGRRIVELGPVHGWLAAAIALGLFGGGLALGLVLGRAEVAPPAPALASRPKPAPSTRPAPLLAVGGAVSVGGAPPALALGAPEAAPAPAAPSPRLGKIERALPDRGYGLQLGAFDSEAEALRFLGTHAEALGERTVYVVPTELPGRGTWYRVRVGAERSRREADQLRGKLGELGAEALVVSHR